MTRWAGACVVRYWMSGVLRGEVGDAGHGRGGAGDVGDEGVVVAGPEKDGGGVGFDGEVGLAIGLAVAEAGETEDELVDLLLAGGWVDEGDGVEDVVEQGSGNGEIGGLGGEVIAAGGGASGADDDGRRADADELEDVGGSGGSYEGEDDVEAGFGGDEVGPAVDLLGVEEGSALVAGGERVAEEDGVGEVAGVFGLRGFVGGEGVGASAGAAEGKENGSEGESAEG